MIENYKNYYYFKMSFTIKLILFLVIFCFVLYENNREDYTIINKKIEDRTGLDEGSGKIPKNIFQSLSSRYVTKKLYDQTEKWKNKNKDYNYYFFTDNECFKFILDNFGEKYAHAFCSLSKGAFRGDFFRYCVLYIKGGYWADISMLPEMSLDKINDNDYDFIVVNDLNHKNSNKKYYNNYFYSKYTKTNNEDIYQAFLGFSKESPLLKNIIDAVYENIINKINITIALQLTGPGIFGDIYKKYDKSGLKYKELYFKLNIDLIYLHYFLYDLFVDIKNNRKLIFKNSIASGSGVYDDTGRKIITNKFRNSGHHIEKTTNKKHYRDGKFFFYDDMITDNILYFNIHFYKKYNPDKKAIVFSDKDKDFEFYRGIKMEKKYNYIIINNFNLNEKKIKEYKLLQNKGFLIAVNTVELKNKVGLYIDDYIHNNNYSLDISLA